MVDKKGGFRRKSRSKFTKHLTKKGKLSITDYLAEFKVNDKVCLHIEPAARNGIFNPKFNGTIGYVTGKRGNSYQIKVMDGKVEKTLLVHPIHLKKIE